MLWRNMKDNLILFGFLKMDYLHGLLKKWICKIKN